MERRNTGESGEAAASLGSDSVFRTLPGDSIISGDGARHGEEHGAGAEGAGGSGINETDSARPVPEEAEVAGAIMVDFEVPESAVWEAAVPIGELSRFGSWVSARREDGISEGRSKIGDG